MDGNPDVHAKSIREALARQQQVILGSYVDECQSLAQRLSQSASRVAAAAELTARIEQYMRRSEEHTSELQSRLHIVCRLLLEKKKKSIHRSTFTTTQPIQQPPQPPVS